MISPESFRSLALSFKEATEEPHFDKTSFRVRKKIFATLDADRRKAVLKLPEMDQLMFCSMRNIFKPVQGAWGKKGWTEVILDEVTAEMLQDALTLAFCTVAPHALGQFYRNNEI